MSEITIVFRGPRTAQILNDLGQLDHPLYIVAAATGDLMARPGDVTPSQVIALVRQAVDASDTNSQPGHFGDLVRIRVVANGAVVRPLVTVVAGLERLREETTEHEGGSTGTWRRLALTYVEVKRGGGVTEIGIPV